MVVDFMRNTDAFAFRQTVAKTAPPAPPRWVSARDFDLDYHLRRVVAPAPGTLDAVLEMARRAEMEEFDQARPLWEVTLVEGLADGSAALLCKLAPLPDGRHRRGAGRDAAVRHRGEPARSGPDARGAAGPGRAAARCRRPVAALRRGAAA